MKRKQALIVLLSAVMIFGNTAAVYADEPADEPVVSGSEAEPEVDVPETDPEAEQGNDQLPAEETDETVASSEEQIQEVLPEDEVLPEEENGEESIAPEVEDGDEKEDETAGEPAAEDNLTKFVKRLYSLMLDRNADKGGLKTWTDQLKQGKPASELILGFYNSTEFQNAGLSDSEYVDRMYETLMDRTADAGGKKTWTDALKQGHSRKYVLQGFINSSEFKNLCASMGVNPGSYISDDPVDKNPKVVDLITSLYTTMLGRNPDKSGMQTWVKAATSGMKGVNLVEGFTNSSEFQNKVGSDDAAYVTALYKGIMGRTPSSSEVKGWTKYIDQGCTRDYIFQGFINSTEFKNKCAAAGIQPGQFFSSQIEDKNPKVAAFVANLYMGALGRKYDRSGLKWYVTDLVNKKKSGKSVVNEFYNGAEFQNRSLGNSDFVKAAYKGIMGRNADTDGLNGNTVLLNNGKSRQVILDNLTSSSEFKTRCKNAGIEVDAIDKMTERAQGISSPTRYLIMIDLTNHKVGVYEGSAGNWKKLYNWPCGNGAPGTPSLVGLNHMGSKVIYFSGADYRCWYGSVISGDYLIHSVLYKIDSAPREISQSGLGMAVSHGCIRLALENAKWIYDNCPSGTSIYSYY